MNSCAAGARVRLPAFGGYGIELEYMIVDRESLSICPIAAELLRALASRRTATITRGALGWSNELVRHVVETKNVVPTAALGRLPAQFAGEIRDANRILLSAGAMLMPTAMHPWMDPDSETFLWDDPSGAYGAYDRIYGCRGHGWSNLQSMHINLPFGDDREFARLHAAIRLVLPLLPALAASSPIADGKPTGVLDFRLHAYRSICAITPTVSGRVIPETVQSRSEYEATILAPMYAEVAAHGDGGVLQHEWLNSRGAIPRFDRDAIEIRVVDVQECPRADLAIAAAAIAVIKALYSAETCALEDQQAIPTESLHALLLATIRDADQAVIADARYLALLGIDRPRCAASEAWHALLDKVTDEAGGHDVWWRAPIDVMLRRGPLARRILRSLDGDPSRERISVVYRALCECLEQGRLFE